MPLIAPRAVALALLVCTSAHGACPPVGQTKESLLALKAQQWRLGAGEGPTQRTLALDLVDCLGQADPVWRDALAYDALRTWMRGQQLPVAVVRDIHLRLAPVLAAPADADGFRQPFAALALAEVARVDRLQPFLGADERAALVDLATRYLAGVRDYRGHDERDGWRHGVAHGADLLLQLSLHPQLERAQGEALRSAIAAQVMPAGAQFYRHGEPQRLMAPVFYLGRREWWAADDWQAWFSALLARRAAEGDETEAALAQRHNLAAFLFALYVGVQEQGDETTKQRLLPGLRHALQSL